jgi:saccharopine dehydrogenase-like NADP-dependent oxidoreductase
MRIMVEGKKAQKNMRYTFDLYDEYDPATQTHSMARTTAYTASVAARMLNSKVFYQPGLYVPEVLGKHDEVVDFMLSGLAERKVIYKKQVVEF